MSARIGHPTSCEVFKEQSKSKVVYLPIETRIYMYSIQLYFNIVACINELPVRYYSGIVVNSSFRNSSRREVNKWTKLCKVADLAKFLAFRCARICKA